MRAGLLDRRVTIQAATVTHDSSGSSVKTWADVATVAAWVHPLTAREFIAAKQTATETALKVRIRWRSGVTTAMRLVFEGRTLNITGLLEVGRREALDIMCEEVNG